MWFDLRAPRHRTPGRRRTPNLCSLAPACSEGSTGANSPGPGTLRIGLFQSRIDGSRTHVRTQGRTQGRIRASEGAGMRMLGVGRGGLLGRYAVYRYHALIGHRRSHSMPPQCSGPGRIREGKMQSTLYAGALPNQVNQDGRSHPELIATESSTCRPISRVHAPLEPPLQRDSPRRASRRFAQGACSPSAG